MMTFDAFNEETFRRFPKLKEISTAKFDYFGDEEPGCYLIFEDILMDEIKQAAANGEKEYLHQLMNFVEEVAAGDMNCRDLVAIGLGEVLPSIAEAATIYEMCGPMTRRVVLEP